MHMRRTQQNPINARLDRPVSLSMYAITNDTVVLVGDNSRHRLIPSEPKRLLVSYLSGMDPSPAC